MQEHPISILNSSQRGHPPDVPAVRTADPKRRVDNDVLKGETNHTLHRSRERLEMHIRAHLLLRSRPPPPGDQGARRQRVLGENAGSTAR